MCVRGIYIRGKSRRVANAGPERGGEGEDAAGGAEETVAVVAEPYEGEGDEGGAAADQTNLRSSVRARAQITDARKGESARTRREGGRGGGGPYEQEVRGLFAVGLGHVR